MTIRVHHIWWCIVMAVTFAVTHATIDDFCDTGSASCDKCIALRTARNETLCGYYAWRLTPRTTAYACVPGNATGPFNTTQYPVAPDMSNYQFGYCCASLKGVVKCRDCVGPRYPACQFSLFASGNDVIYYCRDKLSYQQYPANTSTCDGCWDLGPRCDACLADPTCVYTPIASTRSGVCLPLNITTVPSWPRPFGRDCNCSYSDCSSCQAGGGCVWNDYGALGKTCEWQGSRSIVWNPTCDADLELSCGNFTSCDECAPLSRCQWCQVLPSLIIGYHDNGICISIGAATCPNFEPRSGLTYTRYARPLCDMDCGNHSGSCLGCTTYKLASGECTWCETTGFCEFEPVHACPGNDRWDSSSLCPIPDQCPPDISCVECNRYPGCAYCHETRRCQRRYESCTQYMSCQEHCTRLGRDSGCVPCNRDPNCVYCADVVSLACAVRPPVSEAIQCSAMGLTLGAVCNLGCTPTPPNPCMSCNGLPHGQCTYCGSTGMCPRLLPGTTQLADECPGGHTIGDAAECSVANICEAGRGACSTCVESVSYGCMYSLTSEDCVPLDPRLIDPHSTYNQWGTDCSAQLDIAVLYTTTRYMKKGDTSNFRLRLDQDTSALRLDPQSADIQLYASSKINPPTPSNYEYASNRTGVMIIAKPDGDIIEKVYYIQAMCGAELCTLILLITPTYPSPTGVADQSSFATYAGLIAAVIVLFATCYVLLSLRQRRQRAAREELLDGLALLGADGGERDVAMSSRKSYKAFIPPSRQHVGRPLILDGGHGARQAVIIIGPADLDFIEALRDTDNTPATAAVASNLNDTTPTPSSSLAAGRFPSVITVSTDDPNATTPPLSREVSALSRDDSFGAPESPTAARRPLLQQTPPRSPSAQSLQASVPVSVPASKTSATASTSVAQAAKARADEDRKRRVEVIASLEQLWLGVLTPNEEEADESLNDENNDFGEPGEQSGVGGEEDRGEASPHGAAETAVVRHAVEGATDEDAGPSVAATST